MTIASEITRIQGAKQGIKDAIEAKGVTVPSNAKIDTYDTYINQISGGGFKPYYYKCANLNTAKVTVSETEYNNLLSDLDNLDTSLMTNMSGMFYRFFYNNNFVSFTPTLDLTGFDTSNVTDMNQMFYYANILKEVNCSGWDTSHVTDMKQMFYYYGNYANGTPSLNLSGWDTSSVTTMDGMFYNANLTKIDLSSFTGESITNVNNMFNGCTSLLEIDMDNFVFPSNMDSVFYRCKNNAKLYVKDATEQQKILDLDRYSRPSAWTTANVIIAGSADDHRGE